MFDATRSFDSTSSHDRPLDDTKAPMHVPSYRLHRAKGLAVVTLHGRDIYLGKYDSPESRDAYDRLISEYIASRGITREQRESLTIEEFLIQYWHHAKQYYPARTLQSCIRPTIRRLRRLFSRTLVSEFGALRLKAFRTSLLNEPGRGGKRLTRRYINDAVAQARAFFKWGVSEELVPPSVYQSLAAVEGLRYGRTDAPDPEPIAPVSDRVVELTLAHLCPTVADMVRVQRLTGMRPGELCRMAIGELDMSGKVWHYKPVKHKTAHHGKSRLVPIGPRAQAILAKYLSHDLAAALFSPIRALAEQHAAERSANQTPFTPSRLRRDRQRARNPKRTLSPFYTSSNYAQAIRRACDAAGVARWAPNRLRHSKATELRKEFGLDAAGAVLGHSRLETTQIYAERSVELAVNAALKAG